MVYDLLVSAYTLQSNSK